jgi:hypothetical protein
VYVTLQVALSVVYRTDTRKNGMALPISHTPSRAYALTLIVGLSL